MAVLLLTEELLFPPPESAREDGLVAIGGDASAERLILAYSQGIFPWPMPGLPLLWFSPDPRFVLLPRQMHVPRSLRKAMRRGTLEVRADTDFESVIRACAAARRPNQDGTWITRDLIEGFRSLHRLGYAHSVEAYEDGELVGGVYGVSLGTAFFGESMFSRSPNASKVAFATLVANLEAWHFSLIDCQVHTDHLERFGARDMPRVAFLKRLRGALSSPTRKGPWELEIDPGSAVALL